jgi:hypothetical protein
MINFEKTTLKSDMRFRQFIFNLNFFMYTVNTIRKTIEFPLSVSIDTYLR